MSRGRCSGCGAENASCKKIRTHVNTCPEYISLFKSEPEKCLDPEDEYRRHQQFLKTDDAQVAKDEARQTKHDAYRANNAAKIEQAKERWKGGTVFRSGHGVSRATLVPDGGRLRMSNNDDPASLAASTWGKQEAKNEPS
jgi:hypothetical protein